MLDEKQQVLHPTNYMQQRTHNETPINILSGATIDTIFVNVHVTCHTNDVVAEDVLLLAMIFRSRSSADLQELKYYTKFLNNS